MRPVPRLAGLRPYAVPGPAAPLDLDLRGNEGARPSAAVFEAIVGRADLLRGYPDARPLEARLAALHGVAPEQVLVTAGADDALDRVCRAMLCPGRQVVVPVPAFEMTLRYARLAGGEVVTVPWPGARFPLDAVLAALGETTAAVVVTSPNNPTGAVARATDLAAISAAAPGALLLVDHAYVEYAQDDLTSAALALPRAVVLRTFSKARGLAGLRVGYAVGLAEVVGWMRAAGAPYSVSGPSLALAEAALDADTGEHLAVVRRERETMTAQLAALGADALPSEANFAFARVRDAAWLGDGLAGLGIGVRTFAGRAGIEDAVRIGCPGDHAALARVCRGLRAVLAPEALLFDMDGVLVDVRGSWRASPAGWGVASAATKRPSTGSTPVLAR